MQTIALGAAGGCLIGAASMYALQLLQESRSRRPREHHDSFVNGSASPSRPRPSRPSGPRCSPDAALTAAAADFSLLPGLEQDLDAKRYVELLRRLIAESKKLQNNPRLGIHPQEKLAAAVVLKELEPYSTKNGGPLILQELEYVPGRSNVKVIYPGTTSETVAFVGSHLDVVPADPESWDKDPFKLTVDGDKLYGRGTTDCLGHVALLTLFLAELGRARPLLKRSVVVLFIAAEEGGETGIGVDAVVERGELDQVKGGPVYWVDSADSEPCCGTSGAISWSLKCKGRLFHSGFPQKGINSIELAQEAMARIQKQFYQDFPPHPGDDAYLFASGSTMKPTQIECAKGSINQICPETTVLGDIRLSPFYRVEDAVKAVETYVKDLNANIESLPTKGAWSSFVLPHNVEVQAGELKRAEVELIWQGDIVTWRHYEGIAVSLDSEGHKALVQSCREARGSVKPYSISGSLPLVRSMQQAGFDIQLIGFGHMHVYHGINEYCSLSDMSKAYEVIKRILCLLEVSCK